MTNCLEFVNGDYTYLCDYNQVINSGIKEMFLEYGGNRKITLRDTKIDENSIKERIKELPQVIFEVTANCNLRCRYCVYNGAYINQRRLTPNNMSFETARKSMDIVYSLIKDREEKQFTLGFYGGEPMLNFEIVKKIVQYGKELFDGWDLRFSMTTNLTLLDDRILDFLIDNNFLLLVSLDGNSENHDAKRVFTNGKGTHRIVMKNLAKINKRDERYYERRVSFSTVFSFDLPLENLYRFFSTNELVKQKRMRFSPVNIFNTTYYETYPYKFDTFRKELRKLFSSVLLKVKDGSQLSGYETYLYNRFQDMGDALAAREFSDLGGSCLFDSRLYLDVEGRFHVCEKMNGAFPIGDVETGFDWQKMAAMANEFKSVIERHCADCNIRLLCDRCFVAFSGDGEFKPDLEFCKNQQETIIQNLERYIRCQEE